MRHFINIVEDVHSLGLPDLSQFTTDAFVDDLLDKGMWTSHGSELSLWWEEGAADYMSPEDRAVVTDKEYANTPDLETMLDKDPELVRRTLKKFLVARMGFIKNMMDGRYWARAITGESELKRRIMVDEKYLEQLPTMRHATIPLGVFWGTEEVEAWGASDDNIAKNPYCLEFTTRINHVEVNWVETIMSRADWSLGDDESEIQLIKGSPITAVERVEVVASDADLSWVGKEITVHPSVRFIA